VVLGVVVALPFLPIVRRYISELSFMGTSVKFREEVGKVAEGAEAVVAKAREQVGQERPPDDGDGALREGRPWPVFVEIGEHLYGLIEEDPKLAVAGLGIEVERSVWELVTRAGLDRPPNRIHLGAAVSLLRKSGMIDADEARVLLDLIRLRNLAVHGDPIEKEDAYKFFSTVESLNDLALGYSLNLAPNEKWGAEGLICQFGHCIERMPLRSEGGERSCPVFGHDCPGGTRQVKACKSEARSAGASRGTRRVGSKGLSTP